MEPLLAVGVRVLCAFSGRRGDLDQRFHLSPTALEGQDGHRATVARRGPGYQSEIRLEGEVEGLLLRGRADGYDSAANRLEEIKTYRGPLDSIKQNQRALHRAQLHVYGYLMCREKKLDSIELTLCYVDADSGVETFESRTAQLDELGEEVRILCLAFREWRSQELLHRLHRDQSLGTLCFPFPNFRSGQRGLAEAVYRASTQNRTLLVEASTGLGKTLATIFPTLKAWPAKSFDKVMFLSARNTGRAPALAALNTLLPQAQIRTLELIARDKACVHPDLECHGDSCPRAKGFYDRLPAARQDAIAMPRWDGEQMAAIASRHQVCPYYLASELVVWADIVVGDYNHFFARNAILFDLTSENEWKVALLVDEAHNLLARGRAMYSASLDSVALLSAARSLPRRMRRVISTFIATWQVADEEETYRNFSEAPARLMTTLQTLIKRIAEWQLETKLALPTEVLDIYFEAIRFHELASQSGSHCFLEVVRETHDRRFRSKLSLCNVYPAPYLSAKFKKASAAILFSGTLQPFQFQKDVLGLPDNTVEVVVDSPFHSSQLSVRIAPIAMRFRDRSKSVPAVARLIADQYLKKRGNYMVFASSFDYLRQIEAALRSDCPEMDVEAQHQRMTGAERNAYLNRFTNHSRTVGLAVMGGIFSESVDLPGDHLIGAFVCTLGLSIIDPTGAEMQRRMDTAFSDGFAYQSLYPAMQRVVQAGGRVIRTPLDQGTLYLIDERFAESRVRRLLPSWWDVNGLRQSAPAKSPGRSASRIGHESVGGTQAQSHDG